MQTIIGVKVCHRRTEQQILLHHIRGYLDFYFPLNLLTPYSLCLQGDKLKLVRLDSQSTQDNVHGRNALTQKIVESLVSSISLILRVIPDQTIMSYFYFFCLPSSSKASCARTL